MNEVHVTISTDYEHNRPVKARAMYNYLASRGLLRKGVGKPGEWEATDSEIREVFENMVGLYAEPQVVKHG